jgi:hypothetical protein
LEAKTCGSVSLKALRIFTVTTPSDAGRSAASDAVCTVDVFVSEAAKTIPKPFSKKAQARKSAEIFFIIILKPSFDYFTFEQSAPLLKMLYNR